MSDIARKIQALVDKAWSTTFPAERDALLAKADALMVRHMIDQSALLDPNRPNTAAAIKGSKPEMRVVQYVSDPNIDPELKETLWGLFYALATHFQCRIGYATFKEAKVVSYPADIDFLELMYVSLQMHLLSNVDPRIDPSITWELNLAALKNAGFKWEVIHQKLQPHPGYPYRGQEWIRAIGVRFTAVYKAWSEAHPEAIRNKSNPAQWRKGLISGYVAEIKLRLSEMRAATLAADKNLPALLNDRKSAVDELFFELFPSLNPANWSKADKAAIIKAGRTRAYKATPVDHQAMGAGRALARTADLTNPNGRVSGATRGEL